MPLASTRHRRTSTRCRSFATKRSSFVAPGNSTLWASIQVVARIEQRARTLGPGPALRIEPARQAKPGRVIREVAIPMIHPELCGMSKAPLAVPIADQVRGRSDAELPGHRGNNSSWHGRRILEERPQKAHGGELQGEPKTVGSAALLDDLRVVGVIEVEVPGQLLGRRIADIPAVALALRGAQEAHGHSSLPTGGVAQTNVYVATSQE